MTKFGRSITRNVSFSAGVTRHFAVFSWSLLFTDISALPEQNLIRQSLVSFCLSIELRVLVRPKMGSPSSSLAFLKGGEFFMDSANIVDLYYPNVSQAFTKPVSTASVNIHGFDWTQPFPGKPFDGDGHGVHLAVAQEMMMNESVVQNSSTVLTSLTFSAPDALMAIGYPTAMHELWHICRHIFISTTPTIKKWRTMAKAAAPSLTSASRT